MSEQERTLEPVEVEVTTRQERERRQRAERRQIEQDSEIDWRSYDRHSTPSRWHVR
jgi:hypothetical protein